MPRDKQSLNALRLDMIEYDFTNITRNVAAREQIKDYKLEYQYSTNKGDGYTGSVRAVSIAGSNKKLDVVFKYSHRDPKAHENLPLRQAYNNEIKYYAKIAPALTKFQAEYNIMEPFNNSAAYYGCINEPLNECIALENVKCSNYELWDRKKLMNPPHLKLALKTFAKLHGTSMAMKRLDSKLYSKITDGLDEFNIWSNFFNKSGFYKQVGDTILTLDMFDPVTEKAYVDKLEQLRKNVANLLDPIINDHDKYDVILQGDCWCNNAMYQYEDMNDRSEPKNVILLDWQVIRTGSVVMDLSYFFYTIAPKEALDNLAYYLKVYHDSLSEHLNAFGLKVNNIYPYEVFWGQWQKISLFGFMLSFTLRKMMLIEPEDAPDFADGVEEFLTNMHIDNNKEKIYKQQMKEIIMHFVDEKFI